MFQQLQAKEFKVKIGLMDKTKHIRRTEESERKV